MDDFLKNLLNHLHIIVSTAIDSIYLIITVNQTDSSNKGLQKLQKPSTSKIKKSSTNNRYSTTEFFEVLTSQ